MALELSKNWISGICSPSRISCSQKCCHYHWINHKFDGRFLCQFGTLVKTVKHTHLMCNNQFSLQKILNITLFFLECDYSAMLYDCIIKYQCEWPHTLIISSDLRIDSCFLSIYWVKTLRGSLTNSVKHVIVSCMTYAFFFNYLYFFLLKNKCI